MAYRNIFYERKHSTIHLWNYQPDGTPVKNEYFFKPYIYLPAGKPDEAQMWGIDGVPLVKKEFDYEWERRKFVEGYKGTVYFNLPPTQQYLLENYHHKDISELTQFPLRTFFFDIEVIADEFPTASESKFPLTSVTVYDSQTKKYYVWGIKRYDEYSCKDHLEGIEPDEIVYEYCVDEKYLLVKFLKFWRQNFPDLISGWNSSTFDIPYIIGRIEKVLGEGKSNKLSPVDKVYGTLKIHPTFKTEYTEFIICAISHLDYMFLYKAFTPGERESYSLDFICYSEIKKGKLDYGDMALQELCAKDWNKFINYNIWDVKLMILLEDAKRYLEIAKFSAFSGFCNLDKAFGKTSIITGVLAKYALDEGKIIPVQTEGDYEKIPGGYVKEPEPGLRECLISYDVSSLYPSLIITMNISPESKVAKIVNEDENGVCSLLLFKERKILKASREKILCAAIKKGWSIASNDCFYDQTTQSIASRFCDTLFKKRSAVKKEMFKLEHQNENNVKGSKAYDSLLSEIKRMDVEQYLYKILLNSTYGAFANRFFSLYDLDCATSITTTGQSLIKKSDEILNDYIEKEWDLPKKDRVAFQDTDSAGCELADICKKLNISIMDSNFDVTPEFNKIEIKIGDHLNTQIDTWVRNTLNSKNPCINFKRESICPKAMWTGKKHYVMYVINKEGKKMNEFKYSGLQLAKSTYSPAMRDLSKRIVEIIMTQMDKNKADEMIYELFDKFDQYDTNIIAERGGIKVLSKWEGKNNGFVVASGTTGTAKKAIWHNELLKILNLQNKYRKIENGAKLKMVLIKECPYPIDAIAYQDNLPPEFGLEVDYEKMFFKSIIKSLDPIYKAMGWTVPHPRIRYDNTEDEVFG